VKISELSEGLADIRRIADALAILADQNQVRVVRYDRVGDVGDAFTSAMSNVPGQDDHTAPRTCW
jgi:hypothetical protein